MSKASDDLPEPLIPVITTSFSRGISRVRFWRLCWRAPVILISLSWHFPPNVKTVKQSTTALPPPEVKSHVRDPFAITREDLLELQEKFRKVKHDINNTLAVIMALSELGQRNPAHYEKLAKAVLQRGPEVVQQLQDFQAALNDKLKAPAPAEG